MHSRVDGLINIDKLDEIYTTRILSDVDFRMND